MQRSAPAVQFYKEMRSLHQGNANNMYHSSPSPSIVSLKTTGQIFMVQCGHNEKILHKWGLKVKVKSAYEPSGSSGRSLSQFQ